MPRLLTPSSEQEIGFTRNFILEPELAQLYLGKVSQVDGALQLNLAELLDKKKRPVADKEIKVVLTIGNSSNDGYLMAGFSGNHANAEYWIGAPSWH